MKSTTKKPAIAVIAMVRINTRIKPKQSQFIKALAKREQVTEGDVIRMMIDAYMGK